MGNEFIIIKYFIECPLLRKEWGRTAEWAKVTERGGVARSKNLKKEEALRIIRSHNLVEVLHTKDGKVWADSRETFRHLYAGDIEIPEHICSSNESRG